MYGRNCSRNAFSATRSIKNLHVARLCGEATLPLPQATACSSQPVENRCIALGICGGLAPEKACHWPRIRDGFWRLRACPRCSGRALPCRCLKNKGFFWSYCSFCLRFGLPKTCSRRRGRGNGSPAACLWSALADRGSLTADELEGHLRQRVGLREHSHGRLREHLVAHKFGHFRGHIHV